MVTEQGKNLPENAGQKPPSYATLSANRREKPQQERT